MISGGYRRGRGFDSEVSSNCDQEAISEWSAYSSSVTRVSLGPLVVLGEKSQMKFFSKNRRPSITFLPVALPHTRKSLKESFKKLYRVCLTSDQPTFVSAANDTFHSSLNDVDWIRQVKGTLQLAGAVVDIMDTHGSSVLVALEEGWDLTTQIISLAELMLDSHYRTLAGFAQLVDKEWLSFGHRFTQRSSQTEALKPSGYSPYFLLFLDCVHQILRQFPTQFEFNEYYLQFLAHHHLSNRFSSFKFDSEEERLYVTFSNPDSSTSIWKFIETCHKQSPIFYNFLFVAPPKDSDPADYVLRPTTNVAALDMWSYYLNEEMISGSSVFDVDLLVKSLRPKPTEADSAASGDHSEETTAATFLQMSYNYGLTSCLFNSMTELLLDSGPRWKDVWESVQREVYDEVLSVEEDSFDLWALDQSRQVASRVHKKCTRDLLYRGRQMGEDQESAAAVEEEAGAMFKQAHQFNSAPFTTTRRKCDLCSHWLLITAKAVVCSQCKYFCHEKCAINTPKNCTRSTTAPPAAHPPASAIAKPSARPANRLASTSTVSWDYSMVPPPRPPRPPPPADLPSFEAPTPSPPPVPPHATPPEANPAFPGAAAPTTTIATAKPAVGVPPANRAHGDRRSSFGSSYANSVGGDVSVGPPDTGSSPPGSRMSSVVAADKGATLPAGSTSSMVSGRAGHGYSQGYPHQHHPATQLHLQHQQQQQQAAVLHGQGTLSTQVSLSAASMQYAGFLYKQGHYLRQWKRRYYILDSVRHQLQYFETDDQSTYRGYIALHDVKAVRTVRSVNFAPKKIPDHAVIEVECGQRIHRFATEDARQAREWRERLETAIS